MKRTTRTRAARSTAATALLALALSGCGGSDGVRAGAAALVGDERLTTDRLAEVVDDALSTPGVGQEVTADVASFQRSVLTEFITVEVVEEAARRAGVELDQGAVDAQYAGLVEATGGPEELAAQAAAAGLSEERVRGIARNRALSEALGQALVPDDQVSDADVRAAYDAQADDFDQVRIAVLVQPTLAEAQALLPQAQGLDEAGFAALATERSSDQASAAQGGDLGLQPRSTFVEAGQPQLAEAAFGAAVGSTLVTEVPQGAAVVRVLERQTTTFEQAAPDLRAELVGPERQAAVEAAVRDAADDLDITVNPRFGRWDVDALDVVAEDDRELSREAGAEPATSEDPLQIPQ